MYHTHIYICKEYVHTCKYTQKHSHEESRVVEPRAVEALSEIKVQYMCFPSFTPLANRQLVVCTKHQDTP